MQGLNYDILIVHSVFSGGYANTFFKASYKIGIIMISMEDCGVGNEVYFI